LTFTSRNLIVKVMPKISSKNRVLFPLVVIAVIAIIVVPISLMAVQQQQQTASQASQNQRQRWESDGKPDNLARDARIKAAADGTLPWSNGGPTAAYREGAVTTFFNKQYYWTSDETKSASEQWRNNGLPKDLSQDARIKPAANGTLPWTDGGPDSIWVEDQTRVFFNNGYTWVFNEKLDPAQQWITGKNPEQWGADARVKPAPGGLLPWDATSGPSASARRGSVTFYFKDKYMWVIDESITPSSRQWLNSGNPVDLSTDPRIKPSANGRLPWSNGGITAAWAEGETLVIFNGPFYWTVTGPVTGTRWFPNER
jgi:hypothetical protein